MKAKCYLSGPVSGRPSDMNAAQFAAAAIMAKDAFDVVNPTANISPDEEWAPAMIQCLQDLMGCEAILLLPGWIDSAGAKIERDFAERIGMRILKYEDLNPYLNDCKCDDVLVKSGNYVACAMCGKVRKIETSKKAV
jgi:hypothetical protein